jgi:hypothetical protein
MKFEVFVLVSVLYQVLLFLLIRRWIKARESHVRSLVDTWTGRTHDGPYPIVLKHANWRRKAVIALAILMIVIIEGTIWDVGSSIETLPWSSIAFGIVMVLALAWGPWAVVVEAYGIVILFDDKKITRLSPWSKERTINWSDIHLVTYSWFWAWFTLKTNKGSIHVTTVIENLDSFAVMMAKSVPGANMRFSAKFLTKALNGPFRY